MFCKEIMGRRKRGWELQCELIGGLTCNFLMACTTTCYDLSLPLSSNMIEHSNEQQKLHTSR